MSLKSIAADFDPSKVPARSADLDAQWTYLEKGIGYVMNHPGGLGAIAHSSLYTVAYNYCRFSASPKLAFGGGRERPYVASKKSGDHEGDLYSKLLGSLAQYFEDMRSTFETLSDIDLLRHYAEEWNRVRSSAKHLDRVFSYLNKSWIKRERDEGRKNILPVATLVLSMWKVHVLVPIQTDEFKFTRTILDLINKERNGEEIDQPLVKNVIDSFIVLGLNVAPDPVLLDFYKMQFEAKFLDASDIYYKKEYTTLIGGNYGPDYPKKVEELLQQEDGRVERYLHESTRQELIDRCTKALAGESILNLTFEVAM